MKTIKFATIALFSAAVIFTSCKKDENGDTEAPTVMITLTASDDTTGAYHNGDTLHFHIHVTDNEEIHEVSTTITREADGSEQLHFHAHPEAATFMKDTMYIISTSTHSDFTVEVEASDASENMKTATASFHSHPM